MKKIFSDNRFLKPCIIVVAIFCFIFVTLLFFSGRKLDSDEGVILYNAWQFWNGNTEIYTSKFLDYIPAGIPLSLFALWKIFDNPSIFFATIFFYVLWLSGLFAVYLISLKHIKQNILRLFVLLFWTIIYEHSSVLNHNSISSVVAIWVLFLLFLIIETKDHKKNIIYLILLGVINATVLWFLQTKGILLFIGSLVTLLITKSIRGKTIFYFVVSFIASSLLLLSITGLKRSLTALFWFPLTLNYLSTNKFQPHYPSMIMSLILAISMFVASFRQKNKIYLLLSIFQVSLFLSIINNYNFSHFSINTYPAIIFCAIYYSDHYSKMKKYLSKITLTLCLCASVFIFTKTLFTIYYHNVFNSSTITELATPQIIKAKNIYAGPFIPGFYYETKKMTTYPLSHVDVINDELREKMLEEIKTKKPEIAFLDFTLIKRLNYNQDNPIDNYIKSNYSECPNKILKTVDVYVLDQSFCP